MNSLLKTVSEQAAADLVALIQEAHNDLLSAIHKAEEESQAQESPLKFNIGFKIAVDLDKGTFTNTLSWSLKQSLDASHTIDDPDQQKLKLESNDGSIRGDGDDVGALAFRSGRALRRALDKTEKEKAE